MLGVVNKTVQPEFVGLWLRDIQARNAIKCLNQIQHRQRSCCGQRWLSYAPLAHDDEPAKMRAYSSCRAGVRLVVRASERETSQMRYGVVCGGPSGREEGTAMTRCSPVLVRLWHM